MGKPILTDEKYETIKENFEIAIKNKAIEYLNAVINDRPTDASHYRNNMNEIADLAKDTLKAEEQEAVGI